MKDFTPRQAQIIGAAIEIIAEKSIQALTIRSLSEKVGVSEPALYRHFESKTAILEGILDLFRRKNSEIFNRILVEEPVGDAQLKAVIRMHCHHLSENPAFSTVMFSETLFQDQRVLSQGVQNLMGTARKGITEILVRGQSVGALHRDIPVEQMVLIIMGALRLLVTQWHLGGYSFDLVAQGNALAETLVALFQTQKEEQYDE